MISANKNFCLICNKKINKNRKFCSINHRWEYWNKHKLLCGEKNFNFNNRWSADQKEKQSKKISAQMTPERRALIGDQHRNKIVSAETRKKWSLNRKGKKRKPLSESAKENLRIKSSLKFTEEYRKKQRETFEKLGLWVPLEQKNDYLFYRERAQWIEGMWNFADEKEAELLKEFGIWNSKRKLLKPGLVRDHKFSRRSGFELKVFPEILRHPCNLQLIFHSENIKKKSSRYRDRDDQSLETLFLKIKNYNLEWKEQQLCLDLISKFENNERYNKAQYIICL